MSTLNPSIISDLQTTSLKDKINQTTNGVDLNWRGYSAQNKGNSASYNVSQFVGGTEVFPIDDTTLSGDYTFEKYKDRANFNRAVAWLASKHGDYVRQSEKGCGLLYALIGKTMNEMTLRDLENRISEAFNKDFMSDMEMMNLSITQDAKNKRLIITMMVRDLTTNKVSSDSVAFSNEVI